MKMNRGCGNCNFHGSSSIEKDGHKALSMIDRAALSFRYGGFFSGFDQVANYIDWITALPWNKRSTDNLDINHAKEILEKGNYAASMQTGYETQIFVPLREWAKRPI